MQLSEHLILGSTLRRHVDHFSTDPDKGCAVQLAYASGDFKKDLSEVYPFWKEQSELCPDCGVEGRVGYLIICHLNDRHKWNIERIADWVRSVEPPDPTEIETHREATAEVLEWAT